MPKPKDKYHHGDLRRALVDASLAIIVRDGAEALTLRNAAREAGVSHAAPYAHFDDMEDLIAAVKDEGFTELHDLIAAALQKASGASPEDKLRAIGRTYLGFAAGAPSKYDIMLRRPLKKDPKPGAIYIVKGQEMFLLLAKEIGRLHAARGTGHKHNAELVVISAWSALHGLCGLWLDGPLSHILPQAVTFEELAEQFLDYILTGIMQS